MKKQCSICKNKKLYSEFFRDRRTSSGLYSACKKCHSKNQKSYQKRNIERIRKYVLLNREKINNNQKVWRSKNREKYNEYQRIHQNKRRRTNKRYRLDKHMTSIISMALAGKRPAYGLKKIVGYDVKELVKHIESKFESWMSWENYGKWVIDHRFPKSYFNYKSTEDIGFKKCWALENLQPLEKIENIKKGNKIIYETNSNNTKGVAGWITENSR